jgi:hypothetical protein
MPESKTPMGLSLLRGIRQQASGNSQPTNLGN